MSKRLITVLLGFALLALAGLTGCDDGKLPAVSAPPLAKEITYYDWADDMPQAVLDAFAAEYGVKVHYQTYEATEEAVRNIQAGKIYDVAIIANEFVPVLAAERRLAEIDYRNVTNAKNLSANFRDMVYDPGNRYCIPYSWGTTGLIVRTDLAPGPLTHWADLWDPRLAGKVQVWDVQRLLMGIALKSLGYSINSENPAELAVAEERLQALKGHARGAGYDPAAAEAALASDEAVAMYGWAGDFRRLRARGLPVAYVLPPEGSILWGDNLVIPANSPNKYTAEVFINFLLRPEITAQFINEIYYATSNEAAYPFIKPEIRDDTVIFPPVEELQRAEVILPLGPAGEKLHADIWARYLSGKP